MTIGLGLAGCGTSGGSSGAASTEPSYVKEPFTHQQLLVEQGARLAVSDGCTACHLNAAGRGIAPSFASFAGHRVTLADGHRFEGHAENGMLEPGELDDKFMRLTRQALGEPGATALFERLQKLEDERSLDWLS